MMTRKRQSSTFSKWSLLCIALLVIGCPGNGGVNPPKPSGNSSGNNAVSGLNYYLPQHVLEVDATSTATIGLVFDFDGEKVFKRPNAAVEGSVAPKLTADRNAAYTLDLKPSKTKDGDLTVHLKENGLLESLNTTSQGRVGDIIGNVVRFATTLFTGFSGLGDAGVAADTPYSMGPSVCEPAAKLPDDLRQLYFQKKDSGDLGLGTTFTVRVGRILLEDAAKLFLSRHVDGCALWQKMLILDRDLQTTQQTLNRHEQVLAKASASQVDALLQKIGNSKARLTRLQAERTEVSARFSAGQRAYLKNEGLVFPPKTTSFDERLALDALPATSDVKDKSREQAQTHLEVNDLQESARLLKSTGFLLSIDAVNAASSTAAGDSSTATACSDTPKAGNMQIHYRAPELRQLTAWKDKGGKMVVDSVRHELLVDPQSTKRCFEFKTSALTERKLELTFGDLGQPTKLVRSHEASAAALTSALAGAAETARDSYVTTLEKLATAEEKKRAIELADLQTEVDRITKEQELLDAEINLKGTTASRDLVLQQKQLAAQLAALNAELDLRKATEGFDQAAELARMQAELDHLMKMLEILQTQMQIDDLKD